MERWTPDLCEHREENSDDANPESLDHHFDTAAAFRHSIEECKVGTYANWGSPREMLTTPISQTVATTHLSFFLSLDSICHSRVLGNDPNGWDASRGR